MASVSTQKTCQVCHHPAHGLHFGALTCRACAVFYRRAVVDKYSMTSQCRSAKWCGIKNGKNACKKCRFEKCEAVGMTPKNFQLGRDLISSTIPRSFERFVGRPNFIITLDPAQLNKSSQRTLIDVTSLLRQASSIFAQGPQILMLNENLSSLERMTIDLGDRRRSKPKISEQIKYGKDDAFAIWEHDFLQVARWLTYCDEFQILPDQLKIKMLKNMWLVWNRILKSVMTADMRKAGKISDRSVMLSNEKVASWDNVDVDVSWCTNLSIDQLMYYTESVENSLLTDAIDLLVETQPTDTELTFMISQLSFNIIGKQFQGEVLKMTDKLEEILTNDLHNYYINEMKNPRYATRLSKLLRINQLFEKNYRLHKETNQIAKVFNIFTVDFSHPEMFEDM